MRPEPIPSRPNCTLGCPILDRCLAGGFPCDSITEILAESGSGKTQLCLQLCLSAQLPPSCGGLSGSSLYLHTEFPFPSRRLHQLSLSFRSRYPDVCVDSPCDDIFVQSVYSAQELFDIIPKIESFLVNAKTRLPVRVIVIDSIAALFRSDFENTPSEMKRRSSLFFKISGGFKALARRFNLAVVVTNQVVDFVGTGDGISGVRIGNVGSLFSSGRRVCAALGLAWANCINSRLFLSRGDNCSGQERRELHVVFAPHLPYSSCEFVIKREGIFGVDASF